MTDRRDRSDGGQALVIFVLALVGLLAAVGLAIDGGTVYLYRRRAQNAADAGAREGARQLYAWQFRRAYEDDTAETEILQAVNAIVEDNDIPDTDGVPGNEVNENVDVYYADAIGDRITDIAVGEPGSLTECSENKCSSEGIGQCCGVEVWVETEFDTTLIRLVGPDRAPIEASATGVYVVSDGTSGLGESALYALGSGCGKDQLTLRGDDPRVIGTAHSNDGVWIPNDRPDIDKLEYVDGDEAIITGDDPVIGEVEELTGTVNPGLPYSTTYYAEWAMEGTYHSGGWTIGGDQTGIHYIDGDFIVQGDNVDLSGLYYVDGDVTIKGSGTTLLKTTIVAEGKIDIRSDSVPCTPWEHPASYPWGIALYSAYEPDDPDDLCSDSDPGLVLHGDNPNREGIYYAPKSRITLDAQTGHIQGTFIAWSISIDGDGWTIEKWRPPSGTFGALERVTIVR